MTLSVESADAIEDMIGRLRDEVRRLARERDDLASELRRVTRQNSEQLDVIFELEQRIAMRDNREE